MGQEAPAIQKKERLSRSYIKSLKRSVATTTLIGNNTLEDRCLAEIAPWTVSRYPGFQRLVLATLDNRCTWSAVKAWRNGRRRLPRWAASMMLAYVEGKRERLEALANELRAWIASPESRDRRKEGGANFRGRQIPRVPAGTARDGE